MRIKELKLTNFRCFESLSIEMDEQLTVLIAPNGAGSAGEEGVGTSDGTGGSGVVRYCRGRSIVKTVAGTYQPEPFTVKADWKIS